MSSAFLRPTFSRASCAALRAAAASTTCSRTGLASFGCVSNQWDSASATAICTTGCTSETDQLVLGLGGEFRVRHLHREHRGQALAHVLADQLDLLLLRQVLGVFHHHAGQRLAEAGLVGAAVALRDVVGEAQRDLVRAVVPPHRQLDADAFVVLRLTSAIGGLKIGSLPLVQPFDEGDQAAVGTGRSTSCAGHVAVVLQRDRQAGIQEGQLAQPPLQHGEVVLDLGEGAGGSA